MTGRVEYLPRRVGGYVAALVHSTNEEGRAFSRLWLLVAMDLGEADWHTSTCAESSDNEFQDCRCDDEEVRPW